MFPLVLNTYLLLMNLQYINLPLCVNTISCYTRIERKGQRMSFCLSSSFNDHSFFWKCSLISSVFCSVSTYTPSGPSHLNLPCSTPSLSSNNTLFFFCLLLPTFLPHPCCLSESVHAEQLSQCSSKNTV